MPNTDETQNELITPVPQEKDLIMPFTNVEPLVITPLSELATGNLETDEVRIGDPGSKNLSTDKDGFFLGANTFASAPFRVDMAGNLYARSATIAGYKLFEAVVGATDADYTTVAAALNAGKTRIFVRNGTYNSEPVWNISTANTIIVGESLGGVAITFADGGANQRHIYVNASLATFQNLKLTAYETTFHSLFYFSSAGIYALVENCITRNKRGRVFDGSVAGNLYASFRNIYFDFNATNDVSVMSAFYRIDRSVAFDCFIDMTALTASGCKFIDTCVTTFFQNCRMETAQSANIPQIFSSNTCFFIGCYFYFHEIAPHANFEGCFFENNGNAPSGFFLDISVGNTRLNNCQVKCANSHNLLRASAAHLQVANCYFDGGAKILLDNTSITITGLQFTNNIWVSNYTTAAINLEVAAGTDNCNVIGNILRNNAGSGFTPTITNSGLNNNVTLNQTYM